MPKVAVASLRQRNIMSCDMQAKRGEAAGAEIVQLAAERPEEPTTPSIPRTHCAHEKI
jgi:hypothetical protein